MKTPRESSELTLQKTTERLPASNIITEVINAINKCLKEKPKNDLLGTIHFGNVHISIQASKTHYSIPKKDNADYYEAIEIGYPSETPPDYIMPFIEFGSENLNNPVYAFVPINLVAKWIIEKNEIKSLSEFTNIIENKKA